MAETLKSTLAELERLGDAELDRIVAEQLMGWTVWDNNGESQLAEARAECERLNALLVVWQQKQNIIQEQTK